MNKVYYNRFVVGQAANEAEALVIANTFGWGNVSVELKNVATFEHTEQLQTLLESIGHNVVVEGNQLHLYGWQIQHNLEG